MDKVATGEEQKMDKVGEVREVEEQKMTSRVMMKEGEAFQSACSTVLMAVLRCHPSCSSSALR